MINITASSSDIDQMIKNGQSDTREFAEALIRRYSGNIQRLATSILGDPEEAEDIVQETFIEALLHINRYEPGTNLKAWLSEIAVHKCYQVLRKRKSRRAIYSAIQTLRGLLGSPQDPVNATIHKEKVDQLWSAVNALGEKHRIPVILYYVYDFKIREIAQILDLSEGTVSSRLHYAVQKLGKRLKSTEEG